MINSFLTHLPVLSILPIFSTNLFTLSNFRPCNLSPFHPLSIPSRRCGKSILPSNSPPFHPFSISPFQPYPFIPSLFLPFNLTLSPLVYFSLSTLPFHPFSIFPFQPYPFIPCLFLPFNLNLSPLLYFSISPFHLFTIPSRRGGHRQLLPCGELHVRSHRRCRAKHGRADSLDQSRMSSDILTGEYVYRVSHSLFDKPLSMQRASIHQLPIQHPPNVSNTTPFRFLNHREGDENLIPTRHTLLINSFITTPF